VQARLFEQLMCSHEQIRTAIKRLGNAYSIP
jgi:hypothetical protein